MEKEKLTLKSTNERIDSLESKLDLIIGKLNASELTGKVKTDKDYCIIDINGGTIIDGRLGVISPEDIMDEFDNYYVKLPPLFVKVLDNNEVKISTEEFEEAVELVPQLISKYKNSLINGQCRSIPYVAPNFTQFSYKKSKKFAEWVGGEIMNWETQLYIQLVYLATYGTKENNKYIPNENSYHDNERDCAFEDTGNGIGEFLGIEQLFTSGRNFISFDGYCNGYKPYLWNIYKLLNYDTDFNASDKFGEWGDYNRANNSTAAFYSVCGDDFTYAYGNSCCYLRICKSYEKNVKGDGE